MITFDTGVLIALERRDKRAWDRLRRLRERGVPVLVPASCVSEWWRKSPAHVEVRLAVGSYIVPLTERIACAAGEALGSMRRKRRITSGLTIDAQVVATAALHGGGAVLTSDPEDLGVFTGHFPRITIEPM